MPDIEKFTATRIDIKVHSARPRVGQSSDSVWLTVDLPSGGYGLAHDITLFFADPLAAKAVGEALVRAADRAARIAEVNAETAPF